MDSPFKILGDLPEQDFSRPDEKQGVYHKYKVRRTDGRDGPCEKHENCGYFVLDLSHDPFAEPALRAYAAACRGEFPLLADDLEVTADAVAEISLSETENGK